MKATQASLFLIHQETGQRYPIKAEVVLGRTHADLVFPQDDKLSPRHCKVTPTAKGVAVQDLQSATGTKINGHKIDADRSYLLRPGGELALGDQALVLHSISVARKVVRKRRKRAKIDPNFLSLYALILINLLYFAWNFLHGLPLTNPSPEQMTAAGAALNAPTTNGEWWRLFTALFLHYGIMHLVCNMWALFTLSELVVGALGDSSFAILYLFSGLVGTLVNLTLAGGSTVAAGASCAVAGVLGSLGALTVLRRAKLKRLGAYAFLAALAYLIENVYFNKGQFIPLAHVAGALTGFLITLLSDLTDSESSFIKQLQMTVAMTAMAAATTLYVPHKVNGNQLSPVQVVQKELADIHETYETLQTAVEQKTAKPAQVAPRIQAQVLTRLDALGKRLNGLAVENEGQRKVLDLEVRFVGAFQGHALATIHLDETGDGKYLDEIDHWNEQFELIRAEFQQQTDPHLNNIGLPTQIQSPFQMVEREMRRVLHDYRNLGVAVQNHQISDAQMAENIRSSLTPKLNAVATRMGAIIPKGELERRKLSFDRRLIGAYLSQVKSIAAFADTKDPKYNKEIEKWSSQIEALGEEMKKHAPPRSPASGRRATPGSPQ